jgi:RNA polymerase sigma-70 factor (ECF subfamily)
MEPQSVESFVKLLRQGDPDAARTVFDQYVDKLVGMARKRISQRLASRIDAEDVVQSVFRTFFHRAKEGQFEFHDPDDICKTLARITLHKVFRQVAHHQAAKRDAGREMGSGDDAQDLVVNLVSREPTPEEAATLLDHMEHFLAQLKPQDREILELRMQGHSTIDIAEKLGITDRKIRRLMERLRGLASREEFGLPAPAPAAEADDED